MSSSLLNEISKILFILSTVVILLSTIKTGNATDLVDLPLSISSKSVNIHATLTDSYGASKYFIQELISASGASIKGKIVISGEKDLYNIYYNMYSGLTNERLVIHGTNCLAFTFKNNWDQTLPGIDKPVMNLILLLGPSILYRLDHSSIVWKSVADKNIRGTMMRGATTKINKLEITYYCKKYLDENYGIKSQSRIEFSGYDPYSRSSSYKENLILDIYLQNESYDDEHVNEVNPLPGIGCQYYLSPDWPEFPELKTDYVHYTMHEFIKGSTTSQTFSEIHASPKYYLLRLKSALLDVTTEAIYDYKLGVSYLFQGDGECNILPADSSSPGIDSYGDFNLKSLLLVDSAFKYLGKLNSEHRSGFPVDAWEKIRYNVYINGKKVDKAVITQYFAESQNSEIFYGYTLVSTTIAIYKLDSSKKSYTWVNGITRDYMNFEKAGSEGEFHDIFTLKQCKDLSSDKTLTLAFKFKYQGDSYTELPERRVYDLKRKLIDHVISTGNISPLRVDNVQYSFNGAQVEIAATFLDSPNLKYVFNPKTMSVSADTFKKMRYEIKANNENECLDKLSKSQDSINVVIYRPSDSSCGYLPDFRDLKEDTETGEPCSIYHFPLHNLQRIKAEIPLDQIHNTFMRFVLGFTISYYEGNFHETFEVIDIIDKTKNQDSSTDLFQSRIRGNEKLKANNQVTVTVPDAKTFADCYRTCHNSDQLKCNTFSFCSNGDCRVSSLLTYDSSNESYVEQDNSCSIYALNVFYDYSKVPHRKIKTPTSIAVHKSIYSCAESCHASPDCFSFQWCDYQCSFGGFYTDAFTEYYEGCSVFIPKVSEKYQKTGNKIVSDVLYTEMNLNFEQCASLCHGWSDGETGCKSFNYCPKSKIESSCSLTQFSVKSSNTKTIEGGDCSNYELKGESNGKKSKESSSTDVTKGTSGSGAFGIIMLFLFVGALLGFAAPFGYEKVKQMRSASEANESFTWKRQVDAQAENDN